MVGLTLFLLSSFLTQCEAFATSFGRSLTLHHQALHAETIRQSGDISQLSKHQILVVLGSNSSISPFTTKPLLKPVTWSSVFQHIQEKMSWEVPNGRFNGTLGALGFEVLHLDQVYAGTSPTFKKIPIVMLVGLQDDGPEKLEFAKKLSLGRTTVVALDCAAAYESFQVFGGNVDGNNAESEEFDGSSFLTLWWRGIFSKNDSKKKHGLSMLLLFTYLCSANTSPTHQDHRLRWNLPCLCSWPRLTIVVKSSHPRIAFQKTS